MRNHVIKAVAFLTVLLFLPGVISPPSPPTRATFTVNTTADDSDGDTDDGICDTGNADDGFTGLCTLRAAWQQADASAGADVIAFDLGAGIPTITLGSGLGDMTSPIDINGATGGATKVEIKGPGAGPGPGSDSGMLITAGGNTIKNLIMHSFDGSAIILSIEGGSTLEGNWIGIDKTGASAPNATAGLLLDGSPLNIIGGTTEAARNVLDGVIFFDADANTFTGNYVGTTPDGSAATGSGGGLSFVFSAADNVIGGVADGAGNVISGSGGNGVTIGFGSTDNLFEGNFIGTDPTGTTALGNAADGIHISGSSDNIIRGNVISGNGSDGIELREGGAKTIVTGNLIGTDITGTVDLGNGEMGMRLDMAPENTIGGTATEESNLISGNGVHGILVRGEVMEAPFPNIIRGNRIGTNADGTAALPNDGYGIAFEMTPTHFLGSDDGAAPPACGGGCNLISGNTLGGVGLLNEATAIHVTFNLIGLTKDGTMPLPNGGPGVNVVGGNDNMIVGNLVAFNAGPGVRVVKDGEDPALRNKISMNAIFENGGLGIDLGPPGITPNDGDDSDDGPNKLQNTPTITSVTQAGGSTTIEGFVKSTLSGTFHVEIFANDVPDPSGAGEGQMFLGDMMVANEEVFTLTVPGLHENIAATATDGEGNTSEFSGKAGLIVNSEGDLPDADPTNGVCDTGGTIFRDSTEEPECTLRAAIQEANAGTDDEIIFNIPGGIGSLYTIALGSALPTVTASLIIDATSQPGFVFTPIIVLDGSSAGTEVSGLHVTAGETTIRGFVFNNFFDYGVRLSGGGENRILYNFFGTDASGTAASSATNNLKGGLLIDGSPDNLVGGTDIDGNIFGGHTGSFGSGVIIRGAGATGNRVQSNFFGVAFDGTTLLTNAIGIWIDGAPDNLVGGTNTEQGNLISGNSTAGVYIGGAEATDNKVQGNIIGLNADATSAVPNGDGVFIIEAPDNEIGGTGAGQGNVISGNMEKGIGIQGDAAANNKIWNNRIGTTADGTAALGNEVGVHISGAPSTEIGGPGTFWRNIISGNTDKGLVLFGEETIDTRVRFNLIGTTLDGTEALGNGSLGVGVDISGGANNNVIGGPDFLDRNVISGNHHGVLLTGEGTSGNRIEGNRIGTTEDGKQALGNEAHGVLLFSSASNNVIGGSEGTTPAAGCAGACNVISGNGQSGVVIRNVRMADATNDNQVQGNYIGLDTTGDKVLPNGQEGIHLQGVRGTTVGGLSENHRNVISGNGENGLFIDGSSSSLVQSNYIGTDRTGTKALGNKKNGIRMNLIAVETSDENIIGGSREGSNLESCTVPCNVIAGNGTGNSTGQQNGILIEDGIRSEVQGNLIGLGTDGAALGNLGHGLHLLGGRLITVGREPFDYTSQSVGTGNAIAHNGGDGIRVERRTSATDVNHVMLTNGIFENGGLGINLVGKDAAMGVTPNDMNDADDGDDGPNELQNFPIIAGFSLQGPDTKIDATLNHITHDGARRGSYIIEFFASDMSDPSMHGEGRRFVDFREITLPQTPAAPGDNPNNSGFSLLTPTAGGIACQAITATATSTLTGAPAFTSEFSPVKANNAGCLEITKVEFDHHTPEGRKAVGASGTVDGNHVVIKVTVRSDADQDVMAELRIKEIAGLPRDVTDRNNLPIYSFASGAETTVEFVWKETLGFAWEPRGMPLSARQVQVELIDPPTPPRNERVTLDTEVTPLVVRPRPVILVHGLWAEADVWDAFKTELAKVRSDVTWKAFAVGDGTVAGRLNTGANPALLAFSISLEANADQLDTYIEALRRSEDAARVDMVADGSGGLIARQYITDKARVASGVDPSHPVAQVVMFGTPNLGTPCADAITFIPSLPRKIADFVLDTSSANPWVALGSEIIKKVLEKLEKMAVNATNRHLVDQTTDFVNKTFNPAQDQKEVPFYAFAGTGVRYTCHKLFFGEISDGFVEKESVLATKTFGQKPITSKPPVITGSRLSSSDVHFVMPYSQNPFDYARAVLNTYPGEREEQRGGGHQAAPYTEPAAKQQAADDPQFVLGLPMAVPRGETVTLGLPIPEATALGMTLVATDSVTSVLINPAGQEVDRIDAGTPEAASLMRLHSTTFPAAGDWLLELTYDGALDTAFVPVSVWLHGAALTLDIGIGVPDASNQVPVLATLTDDGNPVLGATVVASLAATDADVVVEADLFDDGQHGDGAADDGVYGALVNTPAAGRYLAGVWALTANQIRTASQTIEVAAAGTLQGADMAVAIEPPADAMPNADLAYRLTARNNGPDAASNATLATTLPAGATFTAITPSQGTCAETDGTWTCDLGALAVGAEAEVSFVFQVTEGSLLTLEANAQADENDWNSSNNAASVLTVVGTPTPTEGEAGVPQTFALHANFPNPFNPTTTIRFDVAQAAPVRLQVFNTMGQQVATLVDGVYAPGTYEATFDASALPSGVYVYRIEAGDFKAMQTMVLLK